MRDHTYEGRPIRSLTPDQLREAEDLLHGRLPVEVAGCDDQPLTGEDLASAQRRIALERVIRRLLGEPQ